MIVNDLLAREHGRDHAVIGEHQKTFSACFEDPRFDENWLAAKDAHVLRGAYQFFRPGQSPTAQADLLIAAIARDGGELSPVIDVEATRKLSSSRS